MSATTAASLAAGASSATNPAPRRDRRRHRRDALDQWFAGWRDGRACRPSLEEDAASPDRLRLIISQADHALEARWATLLEQTQSETTELAVVSDEIRRAVARRDRASAQLAAHLSVPPGLDRRFGEERLPDALVRTRRQRDHDRRTAELTEARDKRTNYVHMRTQRQAELWQRMTVALETARAAARSDLTHFDAMAAAYRRGVLRTHFDPVVLDRQTHLFAIPRPDWVRNADVNELLRAAGAESDR